MITPRLTRLVRVPDLHAFRSVLRTLVDARAPDSGSPQISDKEGLPSSLVVVPTRGAGIEARALLESPPHAAFVTRDEMYEALHARLAAVPPRLSPFERDALMQAAAAEAMALVPPPGLSFRLRPGLISEVLRFYDQLRRQSQQVKRFDELLTDALSGGAEVGDRGAQRMLRQTEFLARAFRDYERRVAASGLCDEHLLRDQLLAAAAAEPVRSAIVTVADWIADPNGLFVADFDLLARLPRLETIDIVATEGVLAAGFHERLRQWWPGIEEVAASDVIGWVPRIAPSLLVPRDDVQGRLWFTRRDREEELMAVARRYDLRRASREELGRVAVVFKRPLPYLYLAGDTLGPAGIPFRTSDAFPLAAEPAVAAVDLVLDAIETNFTRDVLVGLLRCPHFTWARENATEGGVGHPAAALRPTAISALDRSLSEARYLGEPGRLEALRTATSSEARPALDLAIAVASELATIVQAGPASVQLARLSAFLAAHFRPLGDQDPWASRERRARTAVLDILDLVSAAHLAHHDPAWTIRELAPAVRRWIEDATFAVDSSAEGVHLLDDQAARYGAFADLTIVGLVETDWPDRPRRNIFYPPRLLSALGWPSEKDRRATSDARFLELVGSASRTTTLSTFTLDDEAIVARSVQLDEVHEAGLSAISEDIEDGAGDTVSDAVSHTVPASDTSPDESVDRADKWAALRLERTPAADVRYHGFVGPVPPRVWSVGALEVYLACPFKFFAQYALRLEEEPQDEEVMDPRREGRFVHKVFEMFFRQWQRAGRGAVTFDNIGDARSMFAAVVDLALEELPDAEAGLARTRLLGSSAAAGLGEAVLRMEAERPTPVVERRLEFRLEGEFEIGVASGEIGEARERRKIRLKGVADRLDLLADGTFRLIDYKLGWPPNRSRALQLPIYGICAAQRLSEEGGRTWTLGEAAYLAFKGPRRVVPLFTTSEERDEVLASAQQRVADTLDAIERGEFPPRPDDVFRCDTCSFAAICRKDYV